MEINCAVHCRTCETAEEPFQKRCERLFGHFKKDLAIEQGELYKVFAEAANLTAYGARLVHSNPPVIVFDSMLTSEEADALAAAGERAGYERSTDAGMVQADGSFRRVVSKSRTSENSWCSSAGCADDEIVVRIQQRLAQVCCSLHPSHSAGLLWPDLGAPPAGEPGTFGQP